MMDGMLKQMLLNFLTTEQKQEIERVMTALEREGKATTVQQVPSVGACRITIEKMEG